MAEKVNYTTHNFRPYDKAIAQELARHQQANRLLQASRWQQYGIAGICGTLMLLILVAAYKLYLYQFAPALPVIQSQQLSPELATALDNIQETSQQSHEAGDDIGLDIEGEIVMFEKVTAETGELVVTGKVYNPKDISKPIDQYCYLEQATSGSQGAVTNLAYVEGEKVITEVSEELLTSFVENYCRFSDIVGVEAKSSQPKKI